MSDESKISRTSRRNSAVIMSSILFTIALILSPILTMLPPQAALAQTTDEQQQQEQEGTTDEGATEAEEGDTVGQAIITANKESSRFAAAASGADYTVIEGDPLTFQITCSTNPTGLTVTCSMVDGPSGATFPAQTGPSPQTGTFTWENAGPVGTYTATFRNTCPECEPTTAESTFTIEVLPQNQPPTAEAGSGQTVNEGDRVTLDGSGSSDPDGTIVRYSWATTGGPAITLGGVNPTFTAPNVGKAGETLVFMLTVEDNDGASATDSVSVRVNDVKGGGSDGGNGIPGGGGSGNGNPPSGNPPGTNPSGGGAAASSVRFPYHFTITQTGTAELATSVGSFPAGTYNLRVEISGDTRYEGSHPQKIIQDPEDISYKKGSVKGTVVIDQVNGNNDVRVSLNNIELIWLTNENNQIDTIGTTGTFSIPYANTIGSAGGNLRGHVGFGQEIKWTQNYQTNDSNIPLTITFSGGPNPGTALFNDDPDSATGQLKFGRP